MDRVRRDPISSTTTTKRNRSRYCLDPFSLRNATAATTPLFFFSAMRLTDLFNRLFRPPGMSTYPYEMIDGKQTAAPVVVEAEASVPVNAYPGSRTEQTTSPRTRVRRVFSFAQLFFFALTFMNSWEAIGGSLTASLWNGGPISLSWGFWLVYAGALAQSASIAEMASTQPIAGAQYHWTHALAPPKWRRFCTWMQGWLTWFAWVSCLASVININANQIQSLAQLNFPSYNPTAWQTTLLMIAKLVVEGLFCVYLWLAVPWLELVSGIFHVTLFVIVMICLVTLAPRHTADFVFFGTSEGASGWTSNFVAFNIGLLTTSWGFVGFDGAVHMSEEVREAKMSVPNTIFGCIAVNGIFAYAFIIALLFCVGDIDAVRDSNYPILQIYSQALGSKAAATAIVTTSLMISVSVSLGNISSVGRLTWAWARDGGFPAWVAHIDRKHRIPIRALWIPIVITILLSLINIASSAAFQVFLALASLALTASYILPIGCMLRARLRGEVQYGNWRLGRWGVPINIFALMYSCWMSVFFCFPTYLPIEGDNFNYAFPIFAFVVLFALFTWFFWAKKKWPGLNKEVIQAVIADSDRNTKD